MIGMASKVQEAIDKREAAKAPKKKAAKPKAEEKAEA